MRLLPCFAIALVVLTLSVEVASAREVFCSDGACFVVSPPHYAKRHRFYFRPQPRDGVPVVEGLHHQLDDYHGTACIWTWRPVATPGGPVAALAPDCTWY